MKHICGLAFALSLSGILMITGCGVRQKTIEDAERRISVLKEKGVPDSSLSEAEVQLYQAKNAKERGNRGVAKKAADSMLVLIAHAEARHKEAMNRLKPTLDSLKEVFSEARTELSGLQLRHLDSLVGVIDSFYNMDWLLQAEAHAEELLEYLPKLQADEKTAARLKPKLVGTWVCTIKKDKKGLPGAVEHKIFKLKRNGAGEFIEKKKGQTSPGLKEDWEFRSKGKWGVKGDTVRLFVDQYTVVKQNFAEYERPQEGGKPYWKKISHPTYDSTITDGSQDRFITYEDLKLDFHKR
ncbi:MAG: hypothetical protein GF344_07365 [Chitinivibrionales bacterium]|nr:hypothetical protein [Chitinivibrionales bacterium]MBD3356728.1 hypothetical protein [Chitinivibrionales bacterium]